MHFYPSSYSVHLSLVLLLSILLVHPLLLFLQLLQLSQDVIVPLLSSYGQKRLLDVYIIYSWGTLLCWLLIILFNFFSIHEIRSILNKYHISAASIYQNGFNIALQGSSGVYRDENSFVCAIFDAISVLLHQSLDIKHMIPLLEFIPVDKDSDCGH